MQCPYCGNDSSVLDSRITAEAVRRRRSCTECKRRFTTYEKLAAPNIKVVKRSGKSVPFDADKIRAALARVGRDRPSIGEAGALRLARAVEAQLLDERVKSIKSGELASRVLTLLADVDKLAYERLAANYMDEAGQLRTDPRSPREIDPGQLGLFGAEADDD